jgi:hypothetical protein
MNISVIAKAGMTLRKGPDTSIALSVTGVPGSFTFLGLPASNAGKFPVVKASNLSQTSSGSMSATATIRHVLFS